MGLSLHSSFFSTVFLSVSLASGASAQQAQTTADLVRQFQDEPVFYRQLDVAKRLASTDDRSVLQALAPWLTQDDRHTRGNTAFVFAKLGDPRGLAVLRVMLIDRADRPLGQGMATVGANLDMPGWWMKSQISADRYYAVHLLGELRDPRTVPILVALLADAELDHKAAWALGEIGVSTAIAPLISALSHRDALVRVSAIHALEKLKAREAIPHLQSLLSDGELPNAGPQVSVGNTALAALEKLR